MFGTDKGRWSGLEASHYQWYKDVRSRGGCVSGKCLKTQALVLFPDVYKNYVDIPGFCASNG